MEDDQRIETTRPLPKRFRKYVESIRKSIRDNKDDSEVLFAVDVLNQVSVKEYVTLQKVHLTADFTVRTRFVQNLETSEFELQKAADTPENVIVEGTLLGFDSYRHNDQAILVYQIELPFDDDTRSFDVVSAPVEGSVLKLAGLSAVEAEERSAGKVMIGHLEKLSKIKDKEFHTYFKRFVQLIESEDEVDGPFMAQLGDLATKMLRIEAVDQDPEMLEAIRVLLTHMVVPEWPYVLKGHEFIQSAGFASVDRVALVAELDAIILLNDYEIEEGGELVTTRHLQPAFVLVDDHKKTERYLPLRRLVILEEKYVDDPSCAASMSRYKTFSTSGILPEKLL